MIFVVIHNLSTEKTYYPPAVDKSFLPLLISIKTIVNIDIFVLLITPFVVGGYPLIHTKVIHMIFPVLNPVENCGG